MEQNEPPFKFYKDCLKSGLHIIHGPAAHGKTAMLIDFSMWALKNKKKILFISLDEALQCIVERCFSNSCENPYPKLDTKNFFTNACDKHNFELSIQTTLPNIKKAVKSFYSKPKKDILVIDGFERVKDCGSKIIQELRKFAKENKISAVISLRRSNREKNDLYTTLDERLYDNYFEIQSRNPNVQYNIKEAEPWQTILNGKRNITYFLKSISRFYSVKELCDKAIMSILSGAKKTK